MGRTRERQSALALQANQAPARMSETTCGGGTPRLGLNGSSRLLDRPWYLDEILKHCNTYLDEIRIAHDNKFQEEIRRTNPSGQDGPERVASKSHQASQPKTDHVGLRRHSRVHKLASRQPT